jgi:hypothetical protein
MRRIRVCYLFATVYKIRTDINRRPHITQRNIDLLVKSLRLFISLQPRKKT